MASEAQAGSKTPEEIEKLVVKLKKTNDYKYLDELHKHFDGFLNKQTTEIATLFNWVSSRSEVYQVLHELFDEYTLKYESKPKGKVPCFVRYITNNIRGRGRGHFRQLLRKAAKTRVLDDVNPSVLVDINEPSIENMTTLIEMIRAAKMCNLSMQEIMMFGCLLGGIPLVKMAKEFGIQKTRASHIKSNLIKKLKKMIVG